MYDWILYYNILLSYSQVVINSDPKILYLAESWHSLKLLFVGTLLQF